MKRSDAIINRGGHELAGCHGDLGDLREFIAGSLGCPDDKSAHGLFPAMKYVGILVALGLAFLLPCPCRATVVVGKEEKAVEYASAHPPITKRGRAKFSDPRESCCLSYAEETFREELTMLGVELVGDELHFDRGQGTSETYTVKDA